MADPISTEKPAFNGAVDKTLEACQSISGQRGSHRQYEHPTKPGKVTIAGKPNKDVPRGTAANILRQAGLPRPKQ